VTDLLSNIIESTRMRGRVFCQTSAYAPWGVRFPTGAQANFHLVTAGTAELIVGNARTTLAQGDLVLLPRGDGHVLADHPRSARIDLATWLDGLRGSHDRARIGGGMGPESRVLCGVYEYDGLGAQHPVLRLLPNVLHVSGPQRRAHRELSETLDALVREHDVHGRGSSIIVSRLLDIMFVQIVRTWAETVPAERAGWIGALTDASLGRTLEAMHADLRRAWTVNALARIAGTSRATLGRRFVAEVGEPPLAYLARARMQEASRLLRGSDDGLAAIAGRVGYESEFAFNRAFRRAFGEPPGEYRRGLRAAA
jgi:AraC-like DNA-binding protein